MSEKIAAERSAFLVSFTVSLYSGAKVAHVSTPPADQIMIQIQTSAICQPPQASPGIVQLERQVRRVEVAVQERQDHEDEERDHQEDAGQVVERDREARPEEVPHPDEQDDPDRDQMLEPDVDATGQMLK